MIYARYVPLVPDIHTASDPCSYSTSNIQHTFFPHSHALTSSSCNRPTNHHPTTNYALTTNQPPHEGTRGRRRGGGVLVPVLWIPMLRGALATPYHTPSMCCTPRHIIHLLMPPLIHPLMPPLIHPLIFPLSNAFCFL